ncbi:hypothetical protein F5884DRAFT_850339 [Xylogone sp. PMI_703]|nr:hypothetical protein F5884DRAFT_850339 [Xylogone sp. PMI_703]
MASFGAMPFDHLFRRCVSGCGDETPSCPNCADGQVCSLVPPTCDSCQKTICIAAPIKSPPSDSGSSGPNVGAIAGGVIGGVIALAAISYLVWRFFVKPRRGKYQEQWNEAEETSAEKEFTMRRDARASTHTVASMASTVLTRASNVIQIAYIPGVTNRSTPSTPGLLVPPVPPIPIALSDSGTPRFEHEHFFMPGDLRDSTYSGISDRTSYARNSVASTIYGKNAVVQSASATVIRGKPALVSVKSSGGNSGGDVTPPVPTVDYGKYGPPSPAFSVGSTFVNSASAATATPMKPQVVKVNIIGPKKKSSETLSAEDAKSQKQPVSRDSNAITIIDDTPTISQGAFPEPVARQPSTRSLGALTEDSAAKTQDEDSDKHKGTPFGDEHAVRD